MRRSTLSLIISCILVAICFVPILRSSLYSDDISNFQLPNSYHDKSGLSIIEDYKYELGRNKGSGRFTPVTILLQSTIFVAFDTVQAYKQYQYIMAVLAAIAFLLYLQTIGLGLNAAVWAVFLIATVQFRALYHDPSLSLHGMYPSIAIQMFLCLGLYALYIKQQRWWQYILALMLYISAHLSSEVGLTTAALLPVTAWVIRAPFMRFLKTYWPFLLVTISYLVYVAWLRQHMSPEAYSGLKANPDPAKMFDVFIKQVYGALPLSTLHRQKSIPSIIWHQLRQGPVFFSLILALAASVAAFFTNYKRSKPFNFRLVFLALAIIIVPAVLLTPSIKYQQELKYGMAYLPVFIQFFGVALLLTYLFQWLNGKAEWPARVMASLLFIAALCSTIMVLGFNSAVIAKASYERGKPAEFSLTSLKDGILSPCPEGSTILITHDYIWQAAPAYAKMFFRATGKTYNVYDLQDWRPDADSTKNIGPCYVLDCAPGKPITSTLYEIDCRTGEEMRILKRYATPCNIQLIEAEQAIFYGNFD